MNIFDVIHSVEMMMLEEFKTTPFHNFYYLFNMPNSPIGGTCSDKVIIFRDKIKNSGLCDPYLHSSFINGQETHRLLKLQINNKSYYCDIGNGWPSIKLFSEDREVTYNAFGIKFLSKINHPIMDIYQIKEGKETPSTSISLEEQTQVKILKDIENRFSNNIEYPFAKGIRFAQVIDNDFLFFKDLELRVFTSQQKTRSYLFKDESEVINEITKRTGYDLAKLGITDSG